MQTKSNGILTRRRFLQQTFAFSAAASLSGCGQSIKQVVNSPSTTAVKEEISHILTLGDWGADGTPSNQSQVAAGMQTYVANQHISTDALIMLGDNFYGSLTGGITDQRWQTQFEQMYPANVFNCPAYAILGNHDYDPLSKATTELAYAQVGNTRWTMPSRYYRFTFPSQNPLITFFGLDSNMLDEVSWATQLQWLTDTLSKPLTTPFLACFAHHPVYSNGPHGDNQTLINSWDPLLRKYGVHLYLAGHDHDLQHLEFAGHPTSFVLSGGGGAPLYELQQAAKPRGPFAQMVSGFTHVQLESDLMTIRHVGADGTVVHAFTKTPNGLVTILL